MQIKRIIESSIDYRGKYGPVVFLAGCNFRCPMCHNSKLVKVSEEHSDELAGWMKNIETRAGRGWYNGVCITGGEPTINNDLPELAEKFKKMGLSVKIDTNGSNPEMLKKLITGGVVDYIALDIKSSKELYSLIAGTNVDLRQIEESVRILAQLPEEKYEFRTTICPVINEKIEWMSEKDAEEMALWIKSLVGDSNSTWIVQTFIARSKEEMLDERLSKENSELKETPRELLEKIKEIIGRYFKAKIV